MRSGVFQAPERSEAGEERLARWQDEGRVHSLRPLVTEPPRGAPRRPRGSQGRALPSSWLSCRPNYALSFLRLPSGCL